MKTVDIATYVGMFFSAWAIGFCSGYIVTKFKDAMNQVG